MNGKIVVKTKSTNRNNKVIRLMLGIIVTIMLVACGKAEDTGSKKSDKACTFSIDCKAILDNMESLADGKKELVPENGIILEETEIAFAEGESVFDILQRVCKEQKILMESSFTVGTGSVYIEGIANLYEFDCGSLSGWQYSVNGESMSESCSEYKVQEGDVIAWRYTCDLGEDLK